MKLGYVSLFRLFLIFTVITDVQRIYSMDTIDARVENLPLNGIPTEVRLIILREICNVHIRQACEKKANNRKQLGLSVIPLHEIKLEDWEKFNTFIDTIRSFKNLELQINDQEAKQILQEVYGPQEINSFLKVSVLSGNKGGCFWTLWAGADPNFVITTSKDSYPLLNYLINQFNSGTFGPQENILFSPNDLRIIVSMLLQQGACLEGKSTNTKRTPLAEAVVKQNIELVDFLIEKGANINALVNGKPLITKLFNDIERHDDSGGITLMSLQLIYTHSRLWNQSTACTIVEKLLDRLDLDVNTMVGMFNENKNYTNQRLANLYQRLQNLSNKKTLTIENSTIRTPIPPSPSQSHNPTVQPIVTSQPAPLLLTNPSKQNFNQSQNNVGDSHLNIPQKTAKPIKEPQKVQAQNKLDQAYKRDVQGDKKQKFSVNYPAILAIGCGALALYAFYNNWVMQEEDDFEDA